MFNQNLTKALNNFSSAIELLTQAIEEKDKSTDISQLNTSSISDALLKATTLLETVTEQNKELIEQNKLLLKTTKEKVKEEDDKKNIKSDKKAGFMSKLGGMGKDIKSAAGSILMMATSILAFGTAFSLIGEVDMGTVISISIAMPLIAMAFSQIANIEDLTFTKVVFASLAMVTMSIAIMFASNYLSQTQEVSFMKLLSAIGISIVLVIISYGAAQLIEATKKVNPANFALLPLVMIGLSYAIMQSSSILAQTTVIPVGTLLNIALFSLSLAVSVTLMAIPLKVFDLLGITPAKAITGSIALLVVAGTIMASSHILGMGDYSKTVPLMWTLSTVVALTLFAIPIALLGLLATTGIGAVAIGLGAVAILLVSGTIVATSHILAQGDYSSPLPIMWTIGAMLGITLFAIPMAALGAIMLTGIGALALAAGAGAVLIVAQTIVESSNILSGGNYTNLPIGWVMGATLLMTVFSTAVSILGILPNKLIDDGINGILKISNSIAQASLLIAGGNYKSNYPTKEWAEGVGLAIGSFAPVLTMLTASNILSIFGGGLKPEDFSETIRGIGFAIVEVANVFNSSVNSGVFKGAPPKEWAEGVGIAIQGFAPVFKILEETDSIFSGLEMEDYISAMKMMAYGIVNVGKIFYEEGITEWLGYPPKEWSENVYRAFQGMANIFMFLKQYNITQSVISEKRNVLISLIDAMQETNTKLYGLMGADASFSTLTQGANSLIAVANSFNALADSISRVNTAASTLDFNSLNGIKMISSSLLTLSIVDTTKLESVLEMLNESKESFSEIFNKTEKQTPNITPVVNPTTDDATMKDLLDSIKSLNAKIDSIVKHTGKVSNYVSQKMMDAGGNTGKLA